jgi:serine/threonine protein phosphatase 1
VSKTFVISDLHGRYDLFSKALDAINAYPTEAGTIVCTGDYIDRGPDSARIISHLKYLVNGITVDMEVVALQGNHENIMKQACDDRSKRNWWFSNGGGSTVTSYVEMYAGRNPNAFLFADADWLDQLPLIYEDKHRIYVHAAAIEGKMMDRMVLQWMIYEPFDRDMGLVEGKHVVHGHHQFKDGPLLLPNRSNFDTLAWATGRLVVGVFDDAIPGGPVDMIEVTGPATDRWN